MTYELDVLTYSGKFTVYLQRGFYNLSMHTLNPHYHLHSEIHCVSQSDVALFIDGSIVEAKPGDIMIIPGEVPHYFVKVGEGALHSAFQINYNADKFKKISYNQEVINEFFAEIRNLKFSQDYTKVASYISLFCNLLFPPEGKAAHPLKDFRFLIQEFFALNYDKDVALSDLATSLHVSERQAERLVIKYLGKTFMEALVHTRMSMAQLLLDSSDISLSNVAKLVGYQSYSGFWKAAQKYNVRKKDI